ncbi:MAG TPA: glycosyltransferase [Candidatus Hydrogenedentes bacterium]|nr:glycosyltransferase [Candidatus Hydrogenedentota bacterium]
MISVVVATYNRAPVLKDMIQSFYEQTGLQTVPFEFLLVDNNSNDTTSEIARLYEGRPGFRYLSEPQQGLSYARNCGIREAKGDIIAFLDDDVIVDSSWLVQIQRCFDETGAEAVGGRSYLLFETEPPAWLGPDFRLFLSEVNLGDKRCEAGNGVRLYGLNLAMKREMILKFGGFNQTLGRKGEALLGGEERALLQKNFASGGKNLYEPAAVVKHRIGADRLQWEYFLRLAAGAGRTRALLDAPAGRITQSLRILETLAKFTLFTVLWIPAAVIMPGRYAPRALYCRHLRHRILLTARMKAFVHTR